MLRRVKTRARRRMRRDAQIRAAENTWQMKLAVIRSGGHPLSVHEGRAAAVSKIASRVSYVRITHRACEECKCDVRIFLRDKILCYILR